MLSKVIIRPGFSRTVLYFCVLSWISRRPGFVLDFEVFWVRVTLDWKMRIVHSTTYCKRLKESFQSLTKADYFAVVTVLKIPGSAHLSPTVARERQRILLTSLP